ncbi:MAG: hypothetical protein GY929_15130 [Actinomycetia bacterium]|nr:hypothetical protein [Actinomycetes bacterium]
MIVTLADQLEHLEDALLGAGVPVDEVMTPGVSLPDLIPDRAGNRGAVIRDGDASDEQSSGWPVPWLPNDLVTWFAWHNGGDLELWPGHRQLSLEEAATAYCPIRLHGGSPDDSRFSYEALRLPITQGRDGAQARIEFRPGGAAEELPLYLEDPLDPTPLFDDPDAPGLTALMGAVAADWEAGRFRWDEQTGHTVDLSAD